MTKKKRKSRKRGLVYRGKRKRRGKKKGGRGSWD